MSQRVMNNKKATFPLVTIYDRELRKAIPVYQITCRECGHEGQLKVNTRAGSLPPEVVSRKFSERGWQVGKTGLRHVCPHCLDAKSRRAPMDKHLSVVKPPAAAPAKAEPPPEPTVKDQRIIIYALDDHYDEQAKRYRGDMTDQKLAEQLGVPWAWVATIREESYGPAVDAETTEFIAAVRKLDARFESVKGVADQAASQIAALLRHVEALREQAGRIEERLGLKG